MAGNQTHHYDMVMEFAEGALSKMLEPLFGGEGGILGDLLQQIPGVTSPGDVFTIDVLFDRPTDVGLPSTAPNPLDIRINLGLGGVSGQVRIVVGLTVDRSEPDVDAIQLDFPNVYWVSITLEVPPLPAVTTRLPAVETWLRGQEPLRLPGFHVTRTTSDPKEPKQLDVAVIDDVSGEDKDAVAFILTFGGGSGDGLNTFTKSFIPGGETGAAAIFFGWVCRIISPKIAESLGVDSSTFDDCTLKKDVDVGDGAKLTKLEIRLDSAGYISVDAKVKKSGFCYDAEGKVSAKIKIAVESGILVVKSEMGDPDIDVDIPWYCYLAAAVIGAVLGGIIAGLVGAIVGAILGPIIMYIVKEVIEGTLNKIVDAIRDKINSGLPNFEVPAYGLSFLFQEVHIDDIQIVYRTEVIDNAPARCEGTVILRSGQGIDLDSGIVGDYDRSGVDLAWMGEGNNRALKTICVAHLGRTGSTSFDTLTRFALYRVAYSMQATVPVSELEIVVTPWTGLDIEIPTLLVYGVLTNEGRVAAVQVSQVEDGYIALRYRTYDTSSPTVRIVGGFSRLSTLLAAKAYGLECFPLKPPRNMEERIAVLAAAISDKAASLSQPAELPLSHEAYLQHETLKGALTSRIRVDMAQPVVSPVLPTPSVPPVPPLGAPSAALPMQIHEALQIEAPDACRVAQWKAKHKIIINASGWFAARCNRIKKPVTFFWYVNGKHLDKSSGQVTVGQQVLDYAVSNGKVTLKATKALEALFELKVKAVGADGIGAETTRCVAFKPEVVVVGPAIPVYQEYLKAYEANFGIVPSASLKAVQVLHS